MAQLKDSLITGDLRVTGTIYGLMSGNAATATKLGTTNVGSTGLPIYLLAGAPTAITDLALSSGSI